MSGQVPNAPDLLVLSGILSFQVVNSGGDVESKQLDIMMGAGTHTLLTEPVGRLFLEDMTAWLSRAPPLCGLTRVVTGSSAVLISASYYDRRHGIYAGR
jgi:hypothetical protein